ncbi:MAG: hypothetical protein IK018_00155 [Lachnospiraceae bacterium]|nr:hypothetical protein [Lachnospiraceae bacterium]
MGAIIVCLTLSAIICNSNINDSFIDSFNTSYEYTIEASENEEILSIEEIQSYFSTTDILHSPTETIQVTYSGKIVPPMEYTLNAVRSGRKYSGVLKLDSYVYKNGVTIATYSGKLSLVE